MYGKRNIKANHVVGRKVVTDEDLLHDATHYLTQTDHSAQIGFCCDLETIAILDSVCLRENVSRSQVLRAAIRKFEQ